LVIIAVAAVLLAMALSILSGEFLGSQLRRLAAYATALGREEAEPAITDTSVSEVRLIGDALQDARAKLSERMDQQRLLSRELNHRVKNLLSVVQAIVSRTFVDARPLPDSHKLASHRLQALARTQDLLVRTDWKELPLRQIVEMELTPFADRVSVDGPEVSLSARQVQNFGLLLHELTTNAVKYGALRGAKGTISVRWRTFGHGADAQFSFTWKEQCAPVAPAQSAGFGTTLLRTVFDGTETTCRLEIEPDGLIYELSLPLSRITDREDEGADEAA
jgi:two-component sensor histidine kinase